jgi:glycosyltransferase involved in cell wall biosynthesis
MKLKKSRIRLLLVIPHLFRGGAECQTRDLCRALAIDRRFEIRVLTFYSEQVYAPQLGYYEDIRAMGIPVDSLFDYYVRGWILLRALRRYLRLYPADIIQSFLSEANTYLLFAAPITTQVLFQGIRNLVQFNLGRRILYFLLQGRVDGYIGNSREVIRQFRRQFPQPEEKLHVIYNGVALDRLRPSRSVAEISRELGLEPGCRVLINVANMHHEFKGHQDLIRAFAIHQKSGSDLLLLVGEGSLRKELESLAWELGCADQIRFLGQRDDVADLLQVADVYVSPSWTEGFSNSIVEAILMGLAVIATDVGGTREVLPDGASAILVRKQNLVELAQALSTPLPRQSALVMERLHQIVDLTHLGRDYADLYLLALGLSNKKATEATI